MPTQEDDNTQLPEREDSSGRRRVPEEYDESRRDSSGEERRWSSRPNDAALSRDRYDSALESGEEGHEGNEMGFFDHLEELRWRIIKSLIALVITSAICVIFNNFLVENILLGPYNGLDKAQPLLNTEMMGQLTLTIQVSLYSGFILAIPFILWQVWGFIRPGLYEKERRYVRWVAVATVFCFMVGIAFAYYIMVPTSLAFTSGYEFHGIENRFTISSYFTFLLGFVLACGVVFEMPMISYGLARFGIVTPAFLKHYRRHAIVVILFLAAVITPTPDPFNQMLLALPLYGLYEISILVSAIASRQRGASMQEENA